jgi:thiosulfate dehydrogenase [quinone] large subunit
MTTSIKSPVAVIGDPSKRRNLSAWEWVKQSRLMSVAWLAMRVWLGAMWIEAGYEKIWGNESAGFMHNGGSGVKGFAAHGAAAYTWWGSFLHSFVVPNSGWIGILVSVAEFLIGLGLVAGCFTRLAALASLALLFTYVMSGTASVCAFYALFAVVILTMWRTASWIGVDGLVASYREHHQGEHHFVHLPWKPVTGTVGGTPVAA